MSVNMAKELAALGRMTVKQLREKHIEVLGETTRSGNKDWLRKRSLLDAAAHILSLGAGNPMRCKDIVNLAVKRQLWTPRKGKTPASTLYAAILREITTKGEASRFVKTERGRFALKDSQYIREQAAKAAHA